MSQPLSRVIFGKWLIGRLEYKEDVELIYFCFGLHA